MLQLPQQERSSIADDDDQPAAAFRVLIVKCDRLGADALRGTVTQAFCHAQTLVCHTAAEALALLRTSPVFLGLLDLTLPDLDGLDLLTMVTEERLASRLLVVSERHDEHSRLFLRAMRLEGYFDCQTEPAENLCGAVRQVAGGGVYFSRSFQTHATLEGKIPLQALLTETELRVFAVLGGGCDDREAADWLYLSDKTVKTHRQNLQDKLGVHTRAELMREAVHRGVVRYVDGRVLHPGFERALARRQTQRVAPARLNGMHRTPSGVRGSAKLKTAQFPRSAA
jgi:DNA-binding NarL/FixJ family response regulator